MVQGRIAFTSDWRPGSPPSRVVLISGQMLADWYGRHDDTLFRARWNVSLAGAVEGNAQNFRLGQRPGFCYRIRAVLFCEPGRTDTLSFLGLLPKYSPP